jgi:hypothetical protein
MAEPVRRRHLRATLILVALATAGMTVLGTSALAAAHTSSQAAGACVSKASSPARVGHIAGIVGAVPASGSCQAANRASRVLGAIKSAGNTAEGTPPLIFHGGAVMGTQVTGPLVITPIFWNPAGHPMASAYKSLITQYLADVASASGSTGNVFSILPEYSGTDGSIVYNVKLGTPVNDTNPLPASACKVNSKDTTGIYADGSGYNACLDDAQVRGEASSVAAAQGLPSNFSHIYVVYLPKHVESCFNAGTTTNAKNACTINFQPSAAFCAYHSFAPNGTVYANMPFPIYLSATGFTCGTNVNFPGVIETPNGNPDADTVINPTSHEVSEAITDPDVSTGWFDSSGFEIGDECNFIYGTTQGTPGQFFNQVINGHHYLTQEEFSNQSFFSSGGGCLQRP